MAYRQCIQSVQSAFHNGRWYHKKINTIFSANHPAPPTTRHYLSSHSWTCQRWSNCSHILESNARKLLLENNSLRCSALMPAVVRNYAQDRYRSKFGKSQTKKVQKPRQVQIRGPMSVRDLASVANIPQGGLFRVCECISLSRKNV